MDLCDRVYVKVIQSGWFKLHFFYDVRLRLLAVASSSSSLKSERPSSSSLSASLNESSSEAAEFLRLFCCSLPVEATWPIAAVAADFIGLLLLVAMVDALADAAAGAAEGVAAPLDCLISEPRAYCAVISVAFLLKSSRLCLNISV